MKNRVKYFLAHTSIRNKLIVMMMSVTLGALAMGYISFLLRDNPLLVSLGVLVYVFFSYCLINMAQKWVTKPIEDLASSLDAITRYQAYDTVLNRSGKDEVGKLIMAFNNLVRSIKDNENQILKAKQDVERASKSKDQFLANMSHELRTPLNSIICHVQILLEEPDLPKDLHATLTIVDCSALSLLEIVNDILDLSKIEAGAIELVSKPFNLASILYSAIDQIKPLAAKKGLEIRSNEEDISLINVTGDQFRLSRILLNLFSNAVKYTIEGHVDIIVSLYENKSAGRLDFVCTVKDTGIGIATDKLDMIFEKFTQAEENPERSFGGTGLGLNITKQLVSMMGGSIKVRSVLGEGSSFTVHIPLDMVSSDSEDQEQIHSGDQFCIGNYEDVLRKPIEKAKILVAEDQEFNQLLVIKLLKRAGVENIIMCNDGFQAFDSYKDNKPDLILMDCHMPHLNGYAATKSIREYERCMDIKKPVSIIALTADAMAGSYQACIEAGMDEYMTKPINEQHFRALLSNWFTLKELKQSETEKGRSDHLNANMGHNFPADLSILKAYANNDEEVERELVDVFFSKTIRDLETLENSMTDGKNRAWSEAAHALKGSACYVGAEKLRRLCDEGQDLLYSTRQDRQSLYREISEEYQNVCKYLQSERLLKES